MDKLHWNEKSIVSASRAGHKQDLRKLLNDQRFPGDRDEYNGSFDDGNHPGDVTDYDVDKALGKVVFYVDKHTDAQIFNRVQKHPELLPIKQIIVPKALQGHTTSFRIKKEKIAPKGGWEEAVWPAIPAESLDLWEIFTRDNGPLRWTKCTYLTFIPVQKDPLTVSIHATIVEYPSVPWNKAKDAKMVDMLPDYVVFRKKLTGAEFKELLKDVA